MIRCDGKEVRICQKGISVNEVYLSKRYICQGGISVKRYKEVAANKSQNNKSRPASQVKVKNEKRNKFDET